MVKSFPDDTDPTAAAGSRKLDDLTGSFCTRLLEQVLFWHISNLEWKLDTFKDHYNGHRVHTALKGKTPKQVSDDRLFTPAQLDRFAWISRCHALLQTPVAACWEFAMVTS